ncbi:MAG TPA: hypothetical protein VLE93_01430 [Candidatus Saccharimonadales bacterium]|nr:hypothetical protein [Candidatus Saccharimonadales bacterium]
MNILLKIDGALMWCGKKLMIVADFFGISRKLTIFGYTVPVFIFQTLDTKLPLAVKVEVELPWVFALLFHITWYVIRADKTQGSNALPFDVVHLTYVRFVAWMIGILLTFSAVAPRTPLPVVIGELVFSMFSWYYLLANYTTPRNTKTFKDLAKANWKKLQVMARPAPNPSPQLT